MEAALPALRSPYQLERERAKKEILSMGPVVLKPLCQALGKGVHLERRFIYEALSQLGSEPHLSIAIEGLKDPDWEIRSAAAQALIEVVQREGTFLDTAVENSLPYFASEEWRGFCRRKVSSQLKQLVHAQNFSSFHDRLLWPIISLGTYSLPPLKEIVLNSHHSLRFREIALNALGRTGHPEAASFIIQFVEENEPNDEELRFAVVEGLGNLGSEDPRVAKILQEYASDDPSGIVRNYSFWGLMIGVEKEEGKAWLREKIVKELESHAEQDPGVLEMIFAIASWFQVESAIPFLEERFEEGEGYLDYYILEALMNLLPPGRKANKIQQKGINHRIPAVQALALAWVGKRDAEEEVVKKLCLQLEAGPWRLEDLHDYRKKTALEALTFWKGKEALPKLKELSERASAFLRRSAVQALAYDGGEESSLALEKRLEDKDEYTRFFAAQFFFQRQDKRAIPILLSFLTMGNFYLEKLSLNLLSTIPGTPGKYPLRGDYSRRREDLKAWLAWGREKEQRP